MMNDHTQAGHHHPAYPSADPGSSGGDSLPHLAGSQVGLILSKLHGVCKSGNGWQAKCPAHPDKNPSLSIREEIDGTILLKCHAGCTAAKVMEVLGLELKDLFPPNPTNSTRKPQVVAEYIYLDANKKPVLKVLRYEPKDFRQQCWDGQGWSWQGEKPKLLYRLPELLAEPRRAVFVVEGEKDADRLARLGLLATCNPGGAGKWRDDYSKLLQGRRVVILPDNDAPGGRHALHVAESLLRHDCIVRVVEPPGLPDKGDVSDWLDAGHAGKELKALIRDTAPLTRPPLALEARWGLSKDEPRRNLTPLKNLLSEPEEQVSWLVRERLPKGGVSILAGKPKTGKSTLARCLCLAVARGEPWLDMETTEGPVFYLAHQELPREVRSHFRRMGASPESDDPIHIWVGAAPEDALAWLRDQTARHKPSLIVIDTLARFLRVKDLNDYAAVSAALEPVMELARQSGAHLLIVHHAGKVDRRGGDSILGSTAIFGEVDTALLLKRTDRYRTLSSTQRYGPDLEETVLSMNEAGWITAGGSRQEADESQMGQAIMEYLRTQSEPVEEKDILQEVEGRKLVKQKALRLLLNQQKVGRSGSGKRGDSFRYFISTSVHPVIYGDAEMQKPNSVASEGKESTYSASRENGDSDDSGKSREQEKQRILEL